MTHHLSLLRTDAHTSPPKPDHSHANMKVCSTALFYDTGVELTDWSLQSEPAKMTKHRVNIAWKHLLSELCCSLKNTDNISLAVSYSTASLNYVFLFPLNSLRESVSFLFCAPQGTAPRTCWQSVLKRKTLPSSADSRQTSGFRFSERRVFYLVVSFIWRVWVHVVFVCESWGGNRSRQTQHCYRMQTFHS